MNIDPNVQLLFLIENGCFYSWLFITERGVPQGDPFSPTLFNIVVCADGILCPTGGTECTNMGGGGAQHSLLCRQWPHSGPQFHLDAGNTDVGGTNIQDSWITEESGKYKDGVFTPRFI